MVRRWCLTDVEPADIVVADSHPFDIDLWQACKGISVAELVVKPGGTIILVTPCPEGLSRHETEIRRTGYLPAGEIVRRVGNGEITDRATACHLMALGRIIERGELIIVSPGLTSDTCAAVGLRSAPAPLGAINAARSRLGREATVAILDSACAMIPCTHGER